MMNFGCQKIVSFIAAVLISAHVFSVSFGVWFHLHLDESHGRSHAYHTHIEMLSTDSDSQDSDHEKNEDEAWHVFKKTFDSLNQLHFTRSSEIELTHVDHQANAALGESYLPKFFSSIFLKHYRTSLNTLPSQDKYVHLSTNLSPPPA